MDASQIHVSRGFVIWIAVTIVLRLDTAFEVLDRRWWERGLFPQRYVAKA
jgi:hypothetical protein